MACGCCRCSREPKRFTCSNVTSRPVAISKASDREAIRTPEIPHSTSCASYIRDDNMSDIGCAVLFLLQRCAAI